MKRRLLCLAVVVCLMCALAPSALAWATLDNYISANFGRSYDVYSGPGTNYYRANLGRAMYGGGAARVYGSEGDWILIGYGLSNGDYRIGYIHKNALNTAKYVEGVISPLNLDHYTAYADSNCRITDDPVMHNKMLCTLAEGTQVTVLGTMGTAWTYIEAMTSQGLMRGFVWSIHLKNSNAPYTMPTSTPLPTPMPTPVPQPVYQVVTYPPQVWPVVTAAPQVPVWTVVTTPPQPTARPVITAAPWQPAPTAVPQQLGGDWLPAPRNVSIGGNWPVFSGPGEYYFRANSGKATKGQGVCQVYGIENMGYGNWVLIGYPMTSGAYRMGFIRAEALGDYAAALPALNLRYEARRLRAPAVLTDDPLRGRATVASLTADTYVLFLGYLSGSDTTWAYVEALADNQVMRGFIPASAME